ncbi:MAG: TorF family putative porin [Colwellia sp.]|nr:TorF family putative porin [Colwellia sp.]
MKKTITTIAMTSLLAASAFSFQASATEGLSANVAMTSNYLWRGVSQTGDEAAVSGGIDYEMNSGFYAGTWVSNVSGGTELDLYAGFGADINDSMSYDVGFIYYAYPDIDGDTDFSEIYASFTFTGLTVGVAVLTSAALDDIDAGDSVYVNADYTVTLGNDAEVNFHLGSGSGDASYDAIDFGVSLSKDNFTFGVSKSDIDGTTNGDDVKFYVSYSVDIAL